MSVGTDADGDAACGGGASALPTVGQKQAQIPIENTVTSRCVGVGFPLNLASTRVMLCFLRARKKCNPARSWYWNEGCLAFHVAIPLLTCSSAFSPRHTQYRETVDLARGFARARGAAGVRMYVENPLCGENMS